MKAGTSKGSGVVGICGVGGRAPPIEYQTVEWLRLVLKPHTPKKGGLLVPFLDTTSLVHILLETERKSSFWCDPKQKSG